MPCTPRTIERLGRRSTIVAQQQRRPDHGQSQMPKAMKNEIPSRTVRIATHRRTGLDGAPAIRTWSETSARRQEPPAASAAPPAPQDRVTSIAHQERQQYRQPDDQRRGDDDRKNTPDPEDRLPAEVGENERSGTSNRASQRKRRQIRLATIAPLRLGANSDASAMKRRVAPPRPIPAAIARPQLLVGSRH